MSGHSKWHNIQKTKGAQDAKRAQAFTKIAREMIVAVKEGGSGDPANNSRLAAVIAKAKATNMPNDNIKRTIEKALGSGSTDNDERVTDEGDGPSGVAIIVETATDNKNRTVAEVRHVFTKYGGAMGESGSVAFQFDHLGVITLDKEKYPDEEAVMNMVLEAGADDVQDNDDTWEVRTSMADFNTVREALEGQGVEMMEAQLAMVPRMLVPVDADTAQKLMRITDALEELDDVQNVYTNADFPEDFDPEA